MSLLDFGNIKEEKYLNQILDALYMGILILDSTGRVISGNKLARQVFDVPDLPDVQNMGHIIKAFPAYKAGTDELYPQEELPISSALQGKEKTIDDLEIEYQGHRIPAETFAVPAFDEAGAVEFIVLAFKDISKQRQAEQQLYNQQTQLEALVAQRTLELEQVNTRLQQDIARRKEIEQELRQLSRAVEQSGSTIVITDLNGDIEFVNPAFTKITGYILAEAIGQNPRILKSGKNSPEFYEQMWSTISRGDIWQGEMINRKKNGELYWESATISPVKDASGTITHYVAVKEDITARKEIEATLQESNKKLQEANNQLAALYAIGQVINSQLQLEAVLNIIARSTAQLLNTATGVILLLDEATQTLSIKGSYGLSETVVKNTRDRLGESIAGRVALTGKPLVVHNLPENPLFDNPSAQNEGLLACASVPLKVGHKAIGTLDVHSRSNPYAFNQEHLDLLNLLAGQVAIAIENARLYTAAQQEIVERKQAEATLQRRNRQLALISHAGQIFTSSLELDEVVQTILEEMHRLFDIVATAYWLYLPETAELICKKAAGPGYNVIIGWTLQPGQGFTSIAAQTGTSQRIADTRLDPRHFKAIDQAIGVELRSLMAIPLKIKDEVIGVLNLGDTTVDRFSEGDLSLVESVAAVAAGAIKNAQLFNKVQHQQHLAESMRQVTTILNSSLDLDTLLNQIIEQLRTVVHYDSCGLFLRDGDDLVMSGGAHLTGPFVGNRIPLAGKNLTARPFKHKRTVIIADVLTDPGWEQWNFEVDVRSWMGAPLVVDHEPIGVLTTDCFIPNAYHEADAQLLQTFANQAALAIKNARLFNQEQQQRQIAESLREVAQVLNSSLNPTEVIAKILEQLRQVIYFDGAGLFLVEGQDLVLSAGAILDQDFIGYRIPLSSNIKTARVYKDQQPIITDDIRKDPFWDPSSASDRILSWMAAPLLAGDKAIGVLTLDSFELNTYRAEDAQVLQTFANQAATAVQNARLFESTRLALEQAETLYTASLALSASMDLQQVLELILIELRKVVPYDSASVHKRYGDIFEIVGATGFANPTAVIGLTTRLPENSRMRQLVATKEPIISADVSGSPEFSLTPHANLGIRAWMGIPLHFGDQVIGSLGIDKNEPNYYTREHARLAMAFAAQAAIAIENARLFNEEQHQRQVAEQALTDLQATQNQLIVQEKMASLGMLTAGIAHEIKNPLNFVTSFAKLSIELAQDLRQLLEQQPFDPASRAEITGILTDLQFNAASINEEGQRANNIVQSMLLHSRSGSGEPQETDINALLAEAVTLAFHSIRAKDTDFEINIVTHYDFSLEPLLVSPQGLSRVFVNLINNAYDASREKKLTVNGNYEACLEISTKNLIDYIEIHIKDNGLGIPANVKDKLFTPFFTTKPTGQGTGLGLSISYDIIVQEHQGAVTVDSVEGEYTTFIITLPK